MQKKTRPTSTWSDGHLTRHEDNSGTRPYKAHSVWSRRRQPSQTLASVKIGTLSSEHGRHRPRSIHSSPFLWSPLFPEYITPHTYHSFLGPSKNTIFFVFSLRFKSPLTTVCSLKSHLCMSINKCLFHIGCPSRQSWQAVKRSLLLHLNHPDVPWHSENYL